MLASFLLMVLSSVIGAHADLSRSWTDEAAHSATIGGYAWLILNCLVSSSFVIFMRYTIRTAGPGQQPFKDFDTVLYNNSLSAPIFLLLSLLGADGSLGEFFSYYADPSNGDEMRSFVWALALSGAFAFFISYASAWCMRITNSTTYSMVGALNKLPIALSGMIVFQDPVTAGSVGAILIGFGSGVLYTLAKLKYDADQKRFNAVLPTSIAEEKPANMQPLNRIGPVPIISYMTNGSNNGGGSDDESVVISSSATAAHHRHVN
jgi:GDP-mannose transporter